MTPLFRRKPRRRTSGRCYSRTQLPAECRIALKSPRHKAMPAPLWKCPKCSRRFANRNQSHFCSTYTLREHLANKTPQSVTLFRHFAKLVKRCGPVRINPEKTRIAFQVRMSFAAVTLRRDALVGHVVLARRLDNPRFTKIEYISPRNHVHSFRFSSPEEMDHEVEAWLREAYAVGQQHHLSNTNRPERKQSEK